MSFLGKIFKTYDGAYKRAQFENAHQSHLVRPYHHYPVPAGDPEERQWRVKRERKRTLGAAKSSLLQATSSKLARPMTDGN